MIFPYLFIYVLLYFILELLFAIFTFGSGLNLVGRSKPNIVSALHLYHSVHPFLLILVFFQEKRERRMAALLMNGSQIYASTAKFQFNIQNHDFIQISSKSTTILSPTPSLPLPSKQFSNRSSTSGATAIKALQNASGKEKGSLKPRVALKFIWMEKHIGVAVDQVIPGYGPVPLSPYYWWPRTDAWEELKTKLEEKNWIPQRQAIVLLNQATDIINLWQQTSGNYLYG